MSTNPKDILGATKPMLGLNPRVGLLWMAKAFEFGAHGRDAHGVQVREAGYGEYNWREHDVSEMVYVHAMERHIADFVDGQDLASDSKVKHLGHIMACCAILLDAEECGALKRDRPRPGKAADLIERMTIKKAAEAVVTIGGWDDRIKTFFETQPYKIEKELPRESEPASDARETRRARHDHSRKGKGRHARRGKARQ